MNCTDFCHDFQHLLEENIPLESVPELKQHTLNCDSCASLAHDFQILFQQVSQISFPEPSISLIEPTFQKIQRREHFRVIRFRLAFAALILFSLTGVFFFWMSRSSVLLENSDSVTPFPKEIAIEPSKQAEHPQVFRSKEEEWALMSKELETSLTHFRHRVTFQGFSISKPWIGKTSPLAEMLVSQIASFSFFKSAVNSSSEPPLKQLGEDFNQLFHEVKEDLGFLSFGL